MRFVLPSLVVALGLVIACSSSDDTTPATTEETPTYAKTVYPLLQQNCALTGCHGANTTLSSGGPPAGVFISPSDKDETYKQLVNKDSTRFKGTKLIVPGDPDNSLLMRKVDGTQAQLGNCPDTGCGTSMPPPEDSNDPSTAKLLSEKRRSRIRAWIEAGAKND